MSHFKLKINVTDNIIPPGILYIVSILIIVISLAIIVLFINTVLYIVLNTVIGRKVAHCNAVIAMATRDENFNKDILLGNKDILLGNKDILLGNKDILLGNKDILYFKTVFQYSFCYGIIKQKE